MSTPSESESDRRRAERIAVNLEFAATALGTYISDLSEYGVFVHTSTPAPLQSKLKLRFTVLLDDPVLVEGEGRVVRLQTEPVPGMGIEFTDLSPEMILRINDVVSRQRPRDSGPPVGNSQPIDVGSTTDQPDSEDVSEAASTLIRGETPSGSSLVDDPSPVKRSPAVADKSKK